LKVCDADLVDRSEEGNDALAVGSRSYETPHFWRDRGGNMSSVKAEATSPVGAILGALARLQVYDVSPTLAEDMPMWFMHSPPEIVPITTHNGEGVAANRVTFSEHTGSHIDAPFHFDRNGATAAEIAVDALLLRPYCKYDLKNDDLQPGELIGLDQLKAAEARAGFALQPGDVAIIETGWDRNLPGGSAGREPGWWGRNEPGVTEEACDYLADAGVSAVASDTAAADIAVSDGEISGAHGHVHAFLPRGILIVEGLTGLAEVPATGLFVALPLKIAGGSGSPTRVILLSE
jgi:arylformamidase